MRLLTLFLLTLTLALPVFATDGVLEINQTCAVQTGCFFQDTAGFPVTINGAAGRSYRLTSDLTVDENTTAIFITASDVGIDLNNFSIVGPVTCSGTPLTCTHPQSTGIGVKAADATRRGISVKNGSITGMGDAGVSLGEQAEVTNLRVRWNSGSGINVITGSTVSGSVATRNGGIGISGNTGSTFSGNTASQNGSTGIHASGSTVSGNTVYQNGGSGIVGFFGSTVSGNTAFSNGTDGIFASGGSIVSDNSARQNGRNGIQGTDGTAIIDNTAFSNGDPTTPAAGIACSAGCTVRGNTVFLNRGDGITVGRGSGVFDNTVRSNTGDGIDCADGGRSYVRGNAVIENTGVGLNLSDPTRPDAVYRDNLVHDNAGGTVSGGGERGGNTCRNLSGGFTDCP